MKGVSGRLGERERGEMCGIVGYVGFREAASVLLNGLRRMEYRGYDSAGVCTIDKGRVYVKKDVGKIDEIHRRLNLTDTPGIVGVAHTRWATHGGVTQLNAHPHTSCRMEISVVHNGIIENYLELKDTLVKEGHVFKSETDSEVIPHLIEKFCGEGLSRKQAILRTVGLLKGSFAFLAAFKNSSCIIGARKDAPLAVGVGVRESFLASDILAFLEYTDRVIFLKNREVAVVNGGRIDLLSFDGRRVDKEVTQVAWEAADISKKEFAHYTVKEIHEQIETFKSALYQDPGKIESFCRYIKDAERVYLTACGTSYHAGLVAKYLLARLVKIPVETVIASEFEHYGGMADGDSVLIAISQSGETADVLEVVRGAHEREVKVLSIVNTVGSSLVRESNLSMLLNCGPEIGVAATKSFTSQLMLIYMIAFKLAKLEHEMESLKLLNEKVEQILASEERVKDAAKKYKGENDFYFIGRGLHFPVALEGALKLKELAYVHAEGMPAGELKHGTLALIDEGTPAVVLNPEDETYHETLSNASEMKARGARIIGVSNKYSELYDDFIKIPRVESIFYPALEVIPLQLFAYYSAVERKQNPDYPRNLAKSVTVK